jgi:hypothetical protein
VATKDDFDQDEWQQLLEMPWVAGIVVIVADPSWRIVGEFKAMAAAAVASVSPGPAETLIKELVSGMEADGVEGGHRDRALRSRCTQISTSSSARRGGSPQHLLGRLFSTQPLVCQLDIYIATND